MEGLTFYLAYAFEALCFCAIINADTIIISFEKISDSEHCRFIIFGALLTSPPPLGSDVTLNLVWVFVIV